MYSFFDGDDADAAPTLRRRRRANRRDRRRQRELEEIDDGARLVRQQRVDEAGAPTKHRRRRIDSEKLAGGFDNGRRVQIELSRPRNRVRQRRSIRQQRVAERFRAVAQVDFANLETRNVCR